jgi:hypothetical protein
MHGHRRSFLPCIEWMDLLYHKCVAIVLVVYKHTTGPQRYDLLDGHLHVELSFHDRGLHVLWMSQGYDDVVFPFGKLDI